MLLWLHWATGYADGLSQINNFHVISSSLSTAGNLNDTDITRLEEHGFEVIIDLRILQPGDVESEQVLQSGMAYLNVPVSTKNPDKAALASFLRTMKQNEGKKVLVHCRSNKRASAMTYLYQVIDQGEDEAVAWQHVLAISEPNETWQAFIETALAARPDL